MLHRRSSRIGGSSACLAPAWLLAAAPVVLAAAPAPAQDDSARDAEAFFELEVRPLLAARCFECHGPAAKRAKGGLRMSGREALLEGGESGPALVPGDPEASLMVQLARRGDPLWAMPPDEDQALSADQLAVLERWVALGAPWPGDAPIVVQDDDGHLDLEAGRERWAWSPVRRPEVPEVARPERVREPLDAFVLARLEQAGLEPAPPASERELVRRAHFDLLGLPPDPEVVRAYEESRAPDKWERLIDQLLARPEYGERQARRWLDVVRYAETNGYERDEEKPFAWRYRDYVVRAFNQDKPYDRFLLEQLAGDELVDATLESRAATGFYRIGTWDSEPDDKRVARLDEQDDVLRAIGEGMLGVTVGCARCHDHMFEPIRQRDYFGMLAFVSNVRPYGPPVFALDSPTHVALDPSAEQIAAWERGRAEHIAELAERRERIIGRWRDRLLADMVAEQPLDVQRAFRKPAGRRSAAERALLAPLAELAPTYDEALASLPDDLRLRLFLLEQEAERAETSYAGGLPWALAVRENGPDPAPVHLLGRGDPDRPQEEVAPAFLPVLCPDDAAARPDLSTPSEGATSSGRRRALAEWIASPAHPTTARVMANRVWQGLFGRGIVPTPSDFGRTGLPPTHPELLDWLASEFVARGWSVKELHRLVMRSAAYRRSSRAADPLARERDPANDLFWRQNLRRLDAEAVRDALLAVAGTLETRRGGPSFYPELQREVMAGASRPGDGWGRSPRAERDRRSLYARVKRGLLVPLLASFDFPDPALPAGRRSSTTTVGQTLALLNGAFVDRQVAALAERVAAAGDDGRARVERLFELALCRAPEPAELEACLAFLEAQTAAFAALPPPRLELAARVPDRLQVDFLAALPAEELLRGPREGWDYVRGRWGDEYNDTKGVDPLCGPAALWNGLELADLALEARVRFPRGRGFGGFLLRATDLGGETAGLEVRLDPDAGAVSALLHEGPYAAPQELARAERALPREVVLDLALELHGETLTASLDGEPVLAVDGLTWSTPGRVGLRAWGEGVELAGLTLAAGEDLRSIEAAPRPAPERCALRALCLAVVNLNEFLYVD